MSQAFSSATAFSSASFNATQGTDSHACPTATAVVRNLLLFSARPLLLYRSSLIVSQLLLLYSLMQRLTYLNTSRYFIEEDDITEQHIPAFKQLLHEHEAIFAKSSTDLRYSSVLEHDIRCVPKTCDYIFYNNFNNKCPITIIFSIVSSKSMRHRIMVSFPTSPV